MTDQERKELKALNDEVNELCQRMNLLSMKINDMINNFNETFIYDFSEYRENININEIKKEINYDLIKNYNLTVMLINKSHDKCRELLDDCEYVNNLRLSCLFDNTAFLLKYHYNIFKIDHSNKSVTLTQYW